MFKPYLYSLLIPGEIWKHQNVCTVGFPLRTPRDRVTETQWVFQSSIHLRYRNIDNDKKLKCLTDLDSSLLNQASLRWACSLQQIIVRTTPIGSTMVMFITGSSLSSRPRCFTFLYSTVPMATTIKNLATLSSNTLSLEDLLTITTSSSSACTEYFSSLIKSSSSRDQTWSLLDISAFAAALRLDWSGAVAGVELVDFSTFLVALDWGDFHIAKPLIVT